MPIGITKNFIVEFALFFTSPLGKGIGISVNVMVGRGRARINNFGTRLTSELQDIHSSHTIGFECFWRVLERGLDASKCSNMKNDIWSPISAIKFKIFYIVIYELSFGVNVFFFASREIVNNNYIMTFTDKSIY